MTTAAPAPTVPPPVPQTPGSKTPGSRTPGNNTPGNKTSGKPSFAADLARRRREVMTPEGVALSFTIASRGARAGALILDLAIISFALIALVIAVVALGLGFLDLDAQIGEASPALELLAILAIAGLFLARYSYFLLFELGPRGATPGKRLVGIRVAARPGSTGAAGRLTAEAVLARNLTRDIEVFMPVAFLLSGGYAQGALGLAATVWLGIFLLFPFFNRDSLRAGDLIAGTFVVEAERAKLARALSLDVAPPGEYRFGPAELSVYGERELQVLEELLRTGDEDALREVAEAICGKIGWQAGAADNREFLEAFYAALRAHLERGLRFGQRKKDKFS